MKVKKSPISPPMGFPFNITSSGISLLRDVGVEMTGPQINAIQNQGWLLFFSGRQLFFRAVNELN